MDEITAGSRLGVDIVQIDDGWQQGVTSTSIYAQERGGLSEGFHSDMGFWHVHSTRFPHGLEPVVSAAAAKGMDIGLWFSPDSSLSFANWEKDAAVLLDLHQRHGIKYFKIDGVNVKDRVGVTNLAHFFTRVMAVSAGKIVLDLDITAGIRPGYFGALSAGPLFVENRYTDWMNYWPHHTLRNLWSLAHWVDPRRLRMEWLNHARKAERYSGDPLAPAAYTPDTLFAMVMLSNPLGWFEVSSLPESYFAVAAQLVTKWREARERLFSGTILPVGDRPDGRVWTGFGSISNDGFACDLLVFRELNESPRHVFQIPGFVGADLNIRVIAGHGCGRSTPEGIAVEIPAPLGYLWVRATSRYSSHQKTSEENI
jgi:alpha-galactosidase